MLIGQALNAIKRQLVTPITLVAILHHLCTYLARLVIIIACRFIADKIDEHFSPTATFLHVL